MKNYVIKLVWFTTIYVMVFTAIYQADLFLSLPVIMSMYLLGLGVALSMVFSAFYEEEHKTSKKMEH
ncbi:hypothetical protein [Flavobacterium sp. HJJ]|uniref:hypothetical protein n=1 Tax=Flavobacterium sp. HJJ TaxID=2783792 RepID=UPI001889D6F6|nr:hypothetical protein [Flavobacterium sp. HJJ]MBF4473430.1 hypothetical protein [Flavobacterium sp. HJJ]